MRQLLCSLLFRALLPLALLAAVLFRQNLFSLIYLLLLFISQLLPGPTPITVACGHTGRFLRATLCLSLLICIAHVIFQIVLLSLGSYGSFINYCEWEGKVFSAIGLHRLNNVTILDGVRLMGLDFIVVLVSAFVYVMCSKLDQSSHAPITDNVLRPTEASHQPVFSTPDRGVRPSGVLGIENVDSCTKIKRKKKGRASELLVIVGEFLILLFFAGAGILQPSVLSAVYFLIFLVVSTWLACNKQLGRCYLLSRTLLLVYTALHFIAIFVYQTFYIQELLPPNSLYARIFGLTALTNCSCQNARTIDFLPLSWTFYVCPLMILGLYWILATVTRYRVINPVTEEPHSGDAIAVITGGIDSKQSSQRSTSSLLRRRKTMRRERAKSLLDDDHVSKSYKTIEHHPRRHRHSLALDPNGSITWPSESEMPDGATNSVLPEEGTVHSRGTRSKCKNFILSPLVSFIKLVAKGSYVGTLIIMMTWSITYHSWLTFFVLLWSCVLWMTPNSRQACLKSSPFLVAYAEALLLLQYLYSLNLNDDELPKQIETVNLTQIGMVKYGNFSYQHLAVKILYTIMFWLTLNQYQQEKKVAAERIVGQGLLLDQLSYNSTVQQTAPTNVPNQQLSEVSEATLANPIMKKMGSLVMTLLTKYWIWVVACMLMVISLGGQEVVLYRIAYMLLFLFFITMFQLSYQKWRKIMYSFWLAMIVYSMLVLILIYTYQFENFPYYWEKYLKVSKDLQEDIGLEVYNSENTGTLFLKLLTPTFFLIITIIQLHYFHKEFLIISDINYREERPTNRDQTRIVIEQESISTAPGPPSTLTAECSKTPSPLVIDETEKDLIKKHKFDIADAKEVFEKNWSKVVDVAEYICEIIWRLLEIHIVKIVLFSVLCLAVYDVCAVHFIFIIFVMIAMPFSRLRIILSHCCSIWASILLISKMIYQLNFVDVYGWKVNCTDMPGITNMSESLYPFNQTIDNREWIGFKKTDNLTSYCKGYIGLIIVLTIQAVVRIRQKVTHYQSNDPLPKQGIVFPEINRALADDGIKECVKYLINYFFYKFGIEFCFVTIIACIGVRLDVFAVLSALWLCIMFLMQRKTLAKIWPFYVAYQCIVLPIQYLMCVGMPPGLCLNYPWFNVLNIESIEWLFLPDFQLSPNAYKIMVDFFQLVFSCCQLYVFSIETSPAAELYEGGSNKEIYLTDTSNLPNPVPDFVTYSKSYLDMMKSLLFFAFYWVTLAIMFLAGTSRISLFAMGYVIGCFIFLWSGNEFYLKPIKALLRMWNFLLAYNVGVILIKSILQVVGCVFLSKMITHFCWVVQLLGIACLKNLKTGDPSTKIDTQSKCEYPEADAGLLWDGVCFAFLLLQKRLFCSYYFQHLVNEIRAQQVLASRGAEMIHEIQLKEFKAQQAAEREVMVKIKKKMDRIRAKHQKAPGGEAAQPDTHFQAIRSGDYYMFDAYSDDEIDLDMIAKSNKDIEDEEAAEVKEKGINALLSQAMKGNIRQTIRRGSSEEDDDVGDSSQLSPIISADRSTEGPSMQHAPISRITSLSLPETIVSPRGSQQAGQSLPPDSSRPTESVNVLEERRKPQGDEDLVHRLKAWLKIAEAFIDGLLVSGTAKLNTVSKDYRYVACQLSKEKKILKEKFACGEHVDGANILDEELLKIQSAASDNKAHAAKVAITLQKGSQDIAESMELVDTPDLLDKESIKDQPTIMRFLIASYYAVVSRSELVCYLMIIINQIKYASILSLPLPLMAFLWGSLSVPRPSKSFWITVITYTEAVVVIKCLFQFDFWKWNHEPPDDSPYNPARIIGVEKLKHYVVYDLAVLLVVFFHRFMLKSLGLWKDSERSTLAATSEEKALEEKDRESQIVDLKDQKSIKDVSATNEEIKLQSLQDQKDDLDDNGPYEDYLEEEESECSEASPLEGIYAHIIRVFEPCRTFFRNLLHPEFRVTVDVYAFMFFCDFINFLIIVFSASAFGTGGSEGDVAAYFQENKVPIPFLIMLIAQFGLIVVDRALYLRKYIFGKLLFQVFLVFLVHLWMFFVLPGVSEKPFTTENNLPPKLWYFIKCVYLLLSSYQIRSGYPTRILGNFFCKKWNYINLYFFKGYLFIPFLYELRSLMDWIWTDTSMNISNWLKMEDIFSNIFILKCNRRAEDAYPTPRGSKRTSLIKYGVGGLLLFIIILIIWFPLLLFALGNTVGVPNQPMDFSVVLSVGSYEPIFKMSAQSNSMTLGLTDDQYESMRLAMFNDKLKGALKFLNQYSGPDVALVNLNGNSTATWAISPPSQSSMIQELRYSGDSKVSAKLSWSLFRNPANSAGVENTVVKEKSINLTDQTKSDLASMLEGSPGILKTGIQLPRIFPQYLKASAKGPMKYDNGMTPPDKELRSLTIFLRNGSFQNNSAIAQWWEVRDTDCFQDNTSPYPFLGFLSDCKFLQTLIFSERVFPSELSIFSGYGIVGLYTTFVLLVSRLVRGFVAGSSFTIMFDDMPYVDRVLQLCHDIYLVRESGEFTLEEDLFAKLIFLYRSPDTLIKWTRLPGHLREDS